MQIKKSYFSLFVVLVPFLMQAQNYKQQFQKDICECMEAKAAENKLGKNPTLLYQVCFQEKLPTYVSDIDAEITATEPREMYAEGQRIRRALKRSFVSELIGSCDFYYQGVEAERDNTLVGLKKIAENTQYFDLVNQAVAMQPTADNYIKRGQVYFGQEKYSSAKTDFQKAIESNENDAGAKLMLAWVYEKTQKYSSAKEVLVALEEKQSTQKVQVLLEIINRKQGGKGAITLPSEVPSIKKSEKKDDLKKLFKLDK